MENPAKSFESKTEARQYARQLRGSWDASSLAPIGAAIMDQLLRQACFRKAKTVLTYVGAMPGELDTRPLIVAALNDSKKVYVPVTQARGNMAWVALTSLDALIRTPRGLLEPGSHESTASPPTTALCIVPGMLFRSDGHRIGFGGGYYDRFLEDHQGTTLALAPAECYPHHFPVEAHDIPVDYVVTENGIFAAEPLSGVSDAVSPCE